MLNITGRIIAKAGAKGNFEPIGQGTHVAICYSIIDLGIQINEKFGKKARKVLFTWELPDETIEVDGEQKPRVISKEYSLSLHERASLRKELEAWRGKTFTKEELDGFDLENVLGKACQIQVIHKETATGKTRAHISSLMGIPKGMPAPKAVNPLIYFAIDSEDAHEKINTLPEWIQGKVRESESWTARTPVGVTIVDDDDLPF